MKDFFVEWGGALMFTIILVTAFIGGSVVVVHYIDASKANCQALIAKNVSAPDSCFKLFNDN